MFIPRFTITPKITRNLEAIGAVFGYFKSIQLPENYKRELVSKAASEAVHASTAIEGNSLTQQQVRDTLIGKKVVALDKDLREVQNYHKAVELVGQAATDDNFKLSVQFLKKVQKMVVVGVRDDIAGKYRTLQVHVGDYLPPQPFKIPPLMQEFVDWINNPNPEDLSPIIYAGIAHYQFVAIHPFEDGNGRVARLLVTLMLTKSGYDMINYFALESYYNRDRKAYYEALSSADKYRVDGEPELSSWLEYFLQGLLVEAEGAKSAIVELVYEDKTPVRKVWLSPNQQKMLKLTVDMGAAKTADYLRVCPLSRKGCYNSLRKLVKLGFLKRIGKKKGSYYKITEKWLKYRA